MKELMYKKEYVDFVQELKARIKSSQYNALKKVNKELVMMYWDIGKMIVGRQDEFGWGKSVVEYIAKDLQKEFVGVSGFSARNIWYMRNLYVTYVRNKKLQPLVAEISWTHNMVILDKCCDDLEREFYMRMIKRLGWTKNVLIHQIENKTYEKTMISQTNFKKTLPSKIKRQAELAIKDEYVFDFLELGEEHSELDLERALVVKVNRFLIEMGGVFAFMGNQYRLEIEGNEYFIDILLYHRKLRCLVAIELKIGSFKPEYIGKMQFYLAALDSEMKERYENSSIGIIVCKEKKRTIVEYALKESKKPIAVTQYKITKKLPKELIKQLPSPEQIQELIEEI